MNLAAIQAQMLQTLLAAMQASDKTLTVGESVRATFAGWTTPDGQPPAPGQPAMAQALVGGQAITILLTADTVRRQAMQPGAVMTLVVEEAPGPASPAQVRLASISQPEGADGAKALSRQAPPLRDAAALRDAAEPTAPSVSPAIAARALAGPVIGAALARQDSLSPLLANLAALTDAAVDPRLATHARSIAGPVIASAQQVLALELPVVGNSVEPPALRQAVTRSGVFHEALLARGHPAEAAVDLKSALLGLRLALRAALGDGAASPLRDDAPQGVASRARADTSSRDPAPSSPPPPAPTAAAPQRPAPPMREGLPQAQAVSLASIDVTRDAPDLMLATLADQTEAALDRMSLSQFASLPTPQESAEATPGNRWFVELPLGITPGPGVLPLEIEEDRSGAGGTAAEARAWRARFALDLEPIGLIHVLVTLQAKAVSVAVWAERESTSRLVRDFAPHLQAALEDDTFERAQIEVITGKPAERPIPSGQYLDRVS